ncbi:glycoside hydrolase family 26 protein [Nocardioides mesophilus]|uniref:Beta-mannanase n=1 Tax=Nocardioides mesophilus TaxID=433659 RepID=A0A7G9R7G1_9ACTN|nr:glycosyl hydrolase [Nocardioides mesophilus]QNN51536.1 beta-mannanase [Nocardioides mesophilus]
MRTTHSSGRETSAALRRLAVLLLALATVALGSVGSAAAARPGGASVTGATTVSADQTFGVAMPDVPWTMAPLSALTASVGRAPTSVMWYAAWSDNAAFPAAQAADVAATGATPTITWEPWNPAGGATQPAYTLDRITAGAFDSYLTSWARQIRSYGKPVVLRFAHEMNGSWYPWSAQANGNTAGDYVAAWKHVRSVFSKQRTSNVVWSWSPNVPYPGSTALGAVYPGDGYVDQVALDGYNWATLQGGSWQSFWEVFGSGVAQLTALTSKPLYLGEVGCPEDGGDKAAWVADMFSTLATHQEIRGFTWFDFQKEADWRIESSTATLDAFRAGLSTY